MQEICKIVCKRVGVYKRALSVLRACVCECVCEREGGRKREQVCVLLLRQGPCYLAQLVLNS